MPDHVDPEACPECACPMEDHHFGQDYIDYAASFINDAESPRDGVNLCADCCACGRDPMEAA